MIITVLTDNCLSIKVIIGNIGKYKTPKSNNKTRKHDHKFNSKEGIRTSVFPRLMGFIVRDGLV